MLGIVEATGLPALCVIALMFLMLGGRLIRADLTPWRNPSADYLDEYLGYLYLLSLVLFPPAVVWLIVAVVAT